MKYSYGKRRNPEGVNQRQGLKIRKFLKNPYSPMVKTQAALFLNRSRGICRPEKGVRGRPENSSLLPVAQPEFITRSNEPI